MNTTVVPIPAEFHDTRVDVVVSKMLGMSRTDAAELINEGRVQVDSRPVVKSLKVHQGSILEVDFPDVTDAEPVAPLVALPILYQDSDIVVVDKPAGIAAHPSPGWSGPTVTDILVRTGCQLSIYGPAERQGIVHRLDVGTSGAMVLARSERAYTFLKDQFRHRQVSKTYHALVQGHPDPMSGTIDAPIGRHPHADHRFAVMSGGRPSITHYDTLEAFPRATLLEIHLETGRTHQIRVHFSALKHPCCGDLTYGADPTLARALGLSRQWLHAYELGLTHPGSGEFMTWQAPYPADLVHALDVIEAASF